MIGVKKVIKSHFGVATQVRNAFMEYDEIQAGMAKIRKNQ